MNELQFVTNALTKAMQRTGPDGREYLVAPGVAIVAGVVGNEFVPPDEIAKAAFGFSGRPLPLYHPMQGNDYISANSPELESKLSVGKFWNATFDGDKLRGEYWIDIAKAQAMGGEAVELLKRLQSNQQIETSTAYGRDFDPTPGTYNGKPYAGIARNLVPDHVAVLVNERGKCSIADGCGLLANAESEAMDTSEAPTQAEITPTEAPVTVATVDCGCQSPQGDNDTNLVTEDVNMSKDKEVQAAVEQPVAVPVANDKAPEKPTVAVNSDDKAIAANAEQLVVVNAELSALKGQISEFATLINDLGGVEKVRDILQTTHANLQAMAANAKREKDMLINQLVGNARCAFRKVDLEKFDIEALSKLAMSLQPADYSARGFSANRMPEAEELLTLDELNKQAVK